MVAEILLPILGTYRDHDAPARGGLWHYSWVIQLAYMLLKLLMGIPNQLRLLVLALPLVLLDLSGFGRMDGGDAFTWYILACSDFLHI